MRAALIFHIFPNPDGTITVAVDEGTNPAGEITIMRRAWTWLLEPRLTPGPGVRIRRYRD